MLSTEPIKQNLAREIQTGKPVSVPFSQMGYTDMVMENALTGNIRINYTLPNNWDFSDDGKLQLSLYAFYISESKRIDNGYKGEWNTGGKPIFPAIQKRRRRT